MNDNPTPAGGGAGGSAAGGGAGGSSAGGSAAGGGGTPPQSASISLWESITFKNATRILTLLIFTLAAFAVIWFALEGKAQVLENLRDIEYARGLITFIVVMGTMLIGILLIISNALGDGNSSDEEISAKERFTRGKEIFMALMGIVGTIVGFYYGSSENKPTTEEILIASPQFDPAEPKLGNPFTLSTHVRGGEPPYTYVITFNGKEKKGSSKNGWINEKFEAPAKNKDEKSFTYEISVTDLKDTNKIYDETATGGNVILFKPLAGESIAQEAQGNSSP